MLEILKEELEAKIDRSLLEVLLMILLRKTILLWLCSKTAKNLHKKPCVFCHKNNHASNRCLKISEPSARKLFLKDNKLCFLCLEKEHSVKSCSLAYSCHKCKGNHNIAICTYFKNQDSLNTASATILSTNSNNILLQTATATVSNFNSSGNLINVQVIFGSGSQHSYMSDKLRLKLPKIRSENIAGNTFGYSKSTVENVDIVPVQFNCGERTIMIECTSTPFLCSDIENKNLKIVAKNYTHLKNLTLADCSPDGKKRTYILIGAYNYYRFIYGNIIRGKIHEPVAVGSSSGGYSHRLF